MTSKVAKKIALSILLDSWRFTCLEGSVIGFVVHMVVVVESGRRRRQRQTKHHRVDCDPTTEDGLRLCTIINVLLYSHWSDPFIIASLFR